MVNTTEKEAVEGQEPGIEMVNINSVNCNSYHSTIVANLKNHVIKLPLWCHIRYIQAVMENNTI